MVYRVFNYFRRMSFIKRMLCYRLPLFLIAYLFAFNPLRSQQITGQVTDTAGNPLPFATIKFGNSKQGMVADLDGKFELNRKLEFIEVSYLNFQSRQIKMTTNKNYAITLKPLATDLNVVVVKSNSNKLKRILNNVVANKDQHNPDKYDWYRCQVYYKMIANISPESVYSKDTSSDARILKKMMDEQHLLVTETMSRRTWKRPASLQEEVIASRMSGFKKSIVSGLVTDVLPFHAYGEFINFNGKDYNSPVSGGLFNRFQYQLADEFLQDNDTIWIINFKPKQNPTDLAGSLFIHSNGFAIAQLIAHSTDSILRRDIGIEQQYKNVSGKWFPEQLNYNLKWEMNPRATIYMKGTSRIDSVVWQQDKTFKFDKLHTIKILPNADEAKDTVWNKIRPVSLDEKEARTYTFMDSVAAANGFDKLIRYAEKLVDSKFPFNKYLDLNVERLLSYNGYEKLRLGWGMQTNEKVFSNLSFGAWAGYGTGDKQWKYGAFAEYFLDNYKEFGIKAAYYNDVRDPGRMQIHKDLDKNNLRIWLMTRVDKVEGYALSVKKKFGYFSTELTGSIEKITPQYNYAINASGKIDSVFKVKEIAFGIRYAFGERSAPLFGRYFSTGSKYPFLYLRLTAGSIEKMNTSYATAVAAIKWEKNINRFGKQRFLLIGGKTFSNQPLPVSKLFAGNGFVADENALYFFGGMQTIRPYEYYSDRFVNFYWMHDFPFRFYELKITPRSMSSAPYLSVGYNVLWGNLTRPEVHQKILFQVPEKPYHETGILMNSLLKFNFMNFGYGALNIGYFYHWAPTFDAAKNGRIVFGLSMEL